VARLILKVMLFVSCKPSRDRRRTSYFVCNFGAYEISKESLPKKPTKISLIKKYGFFKQTKLF
jgi:hypothetical protein